MANLTELDALEILVIVDNELDPISPSPNPSVLQSGGLRDISTPIRPTEERGNAAREMRMDNICCGAHGLSLLITGTKNGRSHTILFDSGPEEHVWERNARRLRADVGAIEVIQLSHWHRDHSGGMLKVLSMINDAHNHPSSNSDKKKVEVDLHPSRPDYRGVHPPNFPVVSLEADPSFAEIESAGGVVRKNAETHTVLDDFFIVSGEIPRVTEYEKGLRFGVRYSSETDVWTPDEEMADERFLMCKLKDKGIVLFTGCSHAGVVNASRHAVELGNPDTNQQTQTPLYAVMGGFHLADASPEQIKATGEDLLRLGPKVLLTGHCTGWRAKFELQRVMPEGTLVPSFVGSKFKL